MQENGVMKGSRMSKAVFYITDKSHTLAGRIKSIYPDAKIMRYETGIIQQEWGKNRLLIFIMAAGIAVRAIAPFIKDKKTDPAVLVLDEYGRFVISLLSGHLGRANLFARELADSLKAQAVITTASDINSLTAIDLWAQDNNLTIENWDIVPFISTRLLNNKKLKIYDETDIGLPAEFIKVKTPETADILITNRVNLYPSKQLLLRPKNITIGIGCNSGTGAEEIESVIKEVLMENNLSFLSISCLATLNKKASEEGLRSFAKKYELEIKSFTPEDINALEGIEKSEAAFKATGAKAVAEPSAILASKCKSLLFKKQKRGNVTVAAAETATADTKKLIQKTEEGSLMNHKEKQTSKSLSNLDIKGRIYIVGTGPGDIAHITPYAQNAIKESDYIVGYGTYLDLIPELTKGKSIVSTGMTEEIDRCKKAIELANEGRAVSVISGGDPGIYAMAGLVFELLRDAQCKAVNSSLPYIEVIPGISALNACAARLGAPLMHDFASISLSDRLTPWEVIAKRLEAAASSDFVLVIYNPKSKGRVEHINAAVSIVQKYRSLGTPVGIVKKAMREAETLIITDLQHMLDHEIDMQTTIIIGNSQTFIWEGWMITPRGYRVTDK